MQFVPLVLDISNPAMQILIDYVLIPLVVGILGIINLLLMLFILLFLSYMVELLMEKKLHLIFKTFHSSPIACDDKEPAAISDPSGLMADYGPQPPMKRFLEFSFRYPRRVVCLALCLIALQAVCVLKYASFLRF